MTDVQFSFGLGVAVGVFVGLIAYFLLRTWVDARRKRMEARLSGLLEATASRDKPVPAAWRRR